MPSSRISLSTGTGPRRAPDTSPSGRTSSPGRGRREGDFCRPPRRMSPRISRRLSARSAAPRCCGSRLCPALRGCQGSRHQLRHAEDDFVHSPRPGDDAPVIGLSRSRIEVRISRAAEQAGLGAGFSGNSPRLGMLLDLEELGVSLLADKLVAALEEPQMDCPVAASNSGLHGCLCGRPHN